MYSNPLKLVLCLGLSSSFAVMLAGCGSGGTALTKSASLTGTVSVPAGTSTRAAASEIPLPGATVSLYDITQNGTAALSGPPVSTTTSDVDGNYQFPTLTAGHNYIVEATKTVTGTGGVPTTLNLGSYVRDNSSSPISATVDPNSTLVSSYVLSQLTANTVSSTEDMSAIANQVQSQITAEQNSGTAPTVDLTKNLEQHQTELSSVETESQKTLVNASYVSGDPWAAQLSGGTVQTAPTTQTGNTGTSSTDNGDGESASSQHGTVNLTVNATTMEANILLVVTDSSNDILDADTFSCPIASDGTFSGSSADKLYSIQGSVMGEEAHGEWSAASGTGSGHWEATNSQGSDSAVNPVGYACNFMASSTSTVPLQGIGFLFTLADGTSIVYAQQPGSALSHSQSYVLMVGTGMGSTGTLTGKIISPVSTGLIPTGTITLTSSSGSTTASGTWNFTNLASGNVFNGSGSFTASLM